jgi:hypothetical protein
MFIAYLSSTYGLDALMIYPSIFAFGLVAFGFLGMGPVTIAVDSYGPVTDNAQSIYELSLIEENPNAAAEIEKEFGFKPDFENAKHYLEANDGAGNTFKDLLTDPVDQTKIWNRTGDYPECPESVHNSWLSCWWIGNILVYGCFHSGCYHRCVSRS